MLEIDNVRFQYDNKDSDKQEYCYNLSLKRGEIIGIFGASGSGKSTLLDLIAGFLTPKSGEIRLDGKIINNIDPSIRPVSILFQSDNLFEHLSVEKNLLLGLEDKKNAKEKIKIALENVKLSDLEKRRANNLSGGQKQRVALARTLLRNKPILLLDEPFAALDEKTADNMQILLKKLVKQHNWHVIIVTHHQRDIAKLTAKNYLLQNGELVEMK